VIITVIVITNMEPFYVTWLLNHRS